MSKKLFFWLSLLTLMFTAVQPFLRGQMPLTADGTLHLYRLISYDHALSDGTLWPRYAAGMAFGYGAPLFNYYSPLSLVPMQLLHLLGLSFVQAWLLGMIFYTFTAGIGAYLLGRVWGGNVAGFVTTAAYVYSPYLLFDSIWRGTVSELASLAVLPFVLWALYRLAYRGKRVDFFLTAVTFALFIPMHNVITLHGGVLIGFYTLYLWLTTSNKIGSGFRLGSALVIGLMLSAFFWLPAITETDYVKINGITANLPDIDVTRNLMTLADVFEPPMTADPTQLQPPIPISLSWVQIMLALPALFGLFILPASRRVRGLIVVSLLLLAGLVFMNLHVSAPVWNIIPLIRYSQFPWRLIGLASLLLAMLAGIGVSLLAARMRSRVGRLVLIIVALIGIAVYAFPWIYSINLPNLNPQNIVDAQHFEREEGFIATSSFGEYLPRWNMVLPDADRLAPRFAEDEIISRLEAPAGVTITSEQWRNTSGHLTLDVEAETTLIFDWFYFPGWEATLDGQPLEITATEPEGLVQVTIPPGTHTLDIALGLTPRQQLAGLISIAGVFALLIGVGLTRRIIRISPDDLEFIAWRPLAVSVFTVGVLVFAFKAVVIDRIDSPLKQDRFAQGIDGGVQTAINANFNREITLLGYDLLTPEAQNEVSLNLYWRLHGERFDKDYSSVVTLRDAQGNLINEMISWQPAGLSTSHWLPGYYLQERVKLPIPPGTPPGTYSLDVALYSPDENRSLDVINAADNPEGVNVTLGTVNVTPSSQPVSVMPAVVINHDFDGLKLAGLELPLPESASVGEEFTLSWVWSAQELPSTDLQVRLAWMQANEIIAETPLIDPVTDHPTGEWQPGETWRGVHRLYVPGALETGRYTIAVERNGEPVTLGEMLVTAPERVYGLPQMQQWSNAGWQNGIRLAGYDTQNGLTLYWQTTESIDQSLRVFVHIVEADGHIVDQRDRVPVNWTRPTTGWDVGEVITDVYDLYPTEGQMVVVGWYEPVTEIRIPVNGGGDFVELR